MNIDSISKNITNNVNSTNPVIIYNVVMLILFILFIILLTTYSFTTSDYYNEISFGELIKDNIEKLAGNVTLKDEDTKVNIIKVWTIYIVIGLVIYLTILNIYRKINHPGGIIKSYIDNHVYESFIVAFVFSTSVLLTTAIKNKPNYFAALIAFLLIFCKSQIIMDSSKVPFNFLNNSVIFALSGVTLIGFIVEFICYYKSTGSFMGSFLEDIPKNTFIAVINTIQTNIVLSILLKKYDNSPTTIYKMFIKFNLYGYIFNLMTSEHGSIF